LAGWAHVDRPKLVDDVLIQQLRRLTDFGSRQPHVLVATVWALPVREHTEGTDHLLQRVGLRLPRRVDALLPKWAVLQGIEDTKKDRSRYAEAALKLIRGVDGRQTVDTKVVT